QRLPHRFEWVPWPQPGGRPRPAGSSRPSLCPDLWRLPRHRRDRRSCAGAKQRRPRGDWARCLSPRRCGQRVAVSRPHPRSFPQSAPHRDHPRGPPHQGLPRQRPRLARVPRARTHDWRSSLTHRRIPAAVLALVLTAAVVVPVSAQIFGGIVYDPTNYANAVLRYGQLEQQLAQLVTTYLQIRTQYLLLLEQSQLLPVNMVARYKSLASPWLPFTAPTAYGTTAPWILTANTGPGAAGAYALATQPLLAYGGA